MLVALAIAAAVTLPSVSATRLDAHSRSIDIDIDICVRCTQPGDTKQTIIILHDDEEGHAAGWNPGDNPGGDVFVIKAPFVLGSEYSIEASFVNPGFASSGTCNLSQSGIPDTFAINCATGDNKDVVTDGATLTYIITK